MTAHNSFRLLFIYSLFFIGTVFSGADLSDPRNNEIELPNRDSLIRAIKTGNLDSVKKICEANRDSVFERDQDKNIPLHYAAQSRHEKAFEIVAYLVFDAQSDSCINTFGKNNYTPLDLAYKYGIKNVADYLKANGAEKSNRFNSSSGKKLYFGYEEETDDNQDDQDEDDEDEGVTTEDDQEEDEEDDNQQDSSDENEEDNENGYDTYEYDSETEY